MCLAGFFCHGLEFFSLLQVILPQSISLALAPSSSLEGGSSLGFRLHFWYPLCPEFKASIPSEWIVVTRTAFIISELLHAALASTAQAGQRSL